MGKRQPHQAPWKSDWLWEWHFQKHGRALGVSTAEAYDASARATIRVGQQFTYRDRGTGPIRVGYFHRRPRRLTVLNEPQDEILTHFRCDEAYARLAGK